MASQANPDAKVELPLRRRNPQSRRMWAVRLQLCLVVGINDTGDDSLAPIEKMPSIQAMPPEELEAARLVPANELRGN